MELLSPAGSREALAAAVQNGADAVYFGGGSFNARRFADNFDGDGMVSAVDYCHERGVRAYITLNTLVFDRELYDALKFAEQLYKIGVDAVLVQDLGLAGIIRRNLPELTLHASTQMGIHDLGGLQYCQQIGLTRAVLARETSLSQIKYLSDNCSIELETFAHGALCMSFSGSCLYSSMSGERSGNRGTCAQPCRKNASVFGRPSAVDFCLSPNDICMIEHLNALRKAGVECVKIEGRMKKPEYVATVTRCYRAALDGADAAELAKLKNELFAFFNRGDFNTAHLYRDSVKTDRVGSSKPDKAALTAAKQSILGESRKREIEMTLELSNGNAAQLSAACGEHSVSKLGAVVQTAGKPQRAEVYAERLQKLGNTPFSAKRCDVRMTEDCYISAAELNSLRRDCIDELLNEFHIHNVVPTFDAAAVTDARNLKARASSFKTERSTLPLYVRVSGCKAAETAAASGAEIIALEPCALNNLAVLTGEILSLREKLSNGQKLILALPNVIITERQHDCFKQLVQLGAFDGIETNNIGQIAFFDYFKNTKKQCDSTRNAETSMCECAAQADFIRIAGIGMNAMNSFTMHCLAELGFDFIMPSPELTGAQLASIAENQSIADKILIGIHGRTPLMQLLHCPVKEHKGCKNCNGAVGNVTDEAGRVFPLVNVHYPDKCLVRMLNCRTTDLIDLMNKMPRAAGYVLSFIGESNDIITERVNAAADAIKGVKQGQYPDSTRGHWTRKVD